MFKPESKVKCKLCNDIIFSSYNGEYVQCKCGAVAIDKTIHYCWLIGKSENIIFIEEEDIVES